MLVLFYLLCTLNMYLLSLQLAALEERLERIENAIGKNLDKMVLCFID